MDHKLFFAGIGFEARNKLAIYNIFTYHTTTAAVVVCNCVLCPRIVYTAQCAQECLAAIRKLASNLYSKLDSKTELAS